MTMNSKENGAIKIMADERFKYLDLPDSAYCCIDWKEQVNLTPQELVEKLNKSCEEQQKLMLKIIRLTCLNQIKPSNKKLPEEITMNLTVCDDKETLERIIVENNELKKENNELEQFNNCLIHILAENGIKLDEYFGLKEK